MIFRKNYYQCLKELENNKILLLIGARQVGKTTILKQLMHTIGNTLPTYFLNLEDPDIKHLLNTHPNKIFEITGSTPREKQVIFIDEIQYLKDPNNILKYLYDEYKNSIKLIVSGSSSFYIDQKFKDSLIGRKTIITMGTLDFEEFLEFKQQKEIKNLLFKKRTLPTIKKYVVQQLWEEYCIYGGYPEIVLYPTNEQKKLKLSEFAFDYVKKDIYDANIADSDKFLSLLKILASQIGELVNAHELANTLNLSAPTIEKYLYVLQKSFHIILIKPFHTNIRKELTKMPKVYFYDTGLRNALINNFDPMTSRSDKGQLLENSVMKQLRYVYGTEAIKYRRTQAKNEVDFIINGSNAYEVKFQDQGIKISKYKSFQELYPQIPLQFITQDTIINQLILKL